jgi:hypothetical protein
VGIEGSMMSRSSWMKMSPIVRVLAVSACAATSERVIPAARNFW